jgi:hypothetical protein
MGLTLCIVGVDIIPSARKRYLAALQAQRSSQIRPLQPRSRGLNLFFAAHLLTYRQDGKTPEKTSRRCLTHILAKDHVALRFAFLVLICTYRLLHKVSCAQRKPPGPRKVVRHPTRPNPSQGVHPWRRLSTTLSHPDSIEKIVGAFHLSNRLALERKLPPPAHQPKHRVVKKRGRPPGSLNHQTRAVFAQALFSFGIFYCPLGPIS